MRVLQGLCVVAATAIAVACGGGTSANVAAAPGTITASASGGTYSASGVSIIVPPGAVATDTAITITTDTYAPAGATLDGLVYHFAPEGLHFAVPISITLPGSNAAEVAYWTDDGSETTYSPQSTTYDRTGATLQVTHFSSGFVGTLPAAGVSCTVQTPTFVPGSTCPVLTTTVESPSFWFVNAPPGLPGGSTDGALATSSLGLNRLANMESGVPLYYANAAHTLYDSDPGFGTALVSGALMTSFTADGSRGIILPSGDCPDGGILKVVCSGGNIEINDYAPLPPTLDAGKSDATMKDATVSDGSSPDASTMTDAGAVDAGTTNDAAGGFDGTAYRLDPWHSSNPQISSPRAQAAQLLARLHLRRT